MYPFYCSRAGVFPPPHSLPPGPDEKLEGGVGDAGGCPFIFLLAAPPPPRGLLLKVGGLVALVACKLFFRARFLLPFFPHTPYDHSVKTASPLPRSSGLVVFLFSRRVVNSFEIKPPLVTFSPVGLLLEAFPFAIPPPPFWSIFFRVQSVPLMDPEPLHIPSRVLLVFFHPNVYIFGKLSLLIKLLTFAFTADTQRRSVFPICQLPLFLQVKHFPLLLVFSRA